MKQKLFCIVLLKETKKEIEQIKIEYIRILPKIIDRETALAK